MHCSAAWSIVSSLYGVGLGLEDKYFEGFGNLPFLSTPWRRSVILVYKIAFLLSSSNLNLTENSPSASFEVLL